MSSEFILLSISVLVIFVIVVPITIVKTKKINKNTALGSDNKQISGDNNSITQIDTLNVYKNDISKEYLRKELGIEEIKSKIKVLFVDDKEFPVVEHLKSIGYIGVDYMKDIKDLDDTKIRFAHIIFIDINGVGIQMGFPNQGMGLCGALKDKYGDKKKVILYSGETDGNIFDKDAKKADATLKKDSDVYQFISYITDYAKKLL